MSSAEVARTAVGILGNIIALFLFLSPVPTFISIWKKGSVEQYSPVPYLATFINCMVWVLYGLPMVHPHSTLVVTINGTGFVIELVYLILFIVFSNRGNRLRVIMIALVEIIFVAIVALLTLTMVHTTQRRSMIVGTICILFNIMMYASPLSVMKLVIRTKSVEYMPFFLSLAAFGNGIAWTTYALIRFDLFITVPNGLGTLFAAAQLTLYAMFYKSTKRQLAERKQGKVEVDLAQVVVTAEPMDKAQNGGGGGVHEVRRT
ncbi:hypothetical protein PVL29_001681 [Vitis rotundifolia]|uniref:Bidirectional sugar transporter SWEET n=1 Tax=Vitis rotundifolia TaxID=103349 RepID=A0AA39AFS0_VITRO|nr:hypothetical protein PVL29_001681 [Vitis rotundifolia]